MITVTLNRFQEFKLNISLAPAKFLWQPQPDFILPSRCIDIWQFKLIPRSDAEHILDDSELERAYRFHFPHHKQRFLAAHSIKRLILAKYLQQVPKEIQFTHNKFGKPLLDGPLEFNISHSQDLGLLALGRDHPLGIDLEYFTCRPYQGIAEYLFSNAEISAWKALDPALKMAGFFTIWAQKEALIKACGLGLSYPTQQFTVPVLAQKEHVIEDPLHNKTWQMITFMPRIACAGALCYHKNISLLRYFYFDYENI